MLLSLVSVQIRSAIYHLAVVLLFPSFLFSQEQPFKLSSPGDYIATGLLIPVNIGAKVLYNHKPSLTIEQIQGMNITNLNGFNRSAVNRRSHSSEKASDYMRTGALIAPFFFMIDNKMREDAGIKGVIYLQTIALTSTEISFVKGLISRARPFIYNPDVPMSAKLKPDANASFFSGHTAITAAATFYMAAITTAVYGSEYDWTWFAAAVPPLLTGFFRYNSGNHFLSDILAGFIVGSVNGFMISQLHRQKN